MCNDEVTNKNTQKKLPLRLACASQPKTICHWWNTSAISAPATFPPQVKPPPSSCEKCNPTHPSTTPSHCCSRETSSWLLNFLFVMSVMLQQHISHATGRSGMWMTAYREVTLYSCCYDAHASGKKKRRSQLSGSFNRDPSALIDTQWIYNALTSYLAAPLSYNTPLYQQVSRQEENTLLHFHEKVNNCCRNLAALGEEPLGDTWQVNSHYFWKC